MDKKIKKHFNHITLCRTIVEKQITQNYKSR